MSNEAQLCYYYDVAVLCARNGWLGEPCGLSSHHLVTHPCRHSKVLGKNIKRETETQSLRIIQHESDGVPSGMRADGV